VQAAHRSSGHLFVSTADCRVAVTGTIFGVSAGAKGSRVSVIQGEVHVDRYAAQNNVAQDNDEKILHPGNQIVTSPDLEPESVHDDISWSRNHDRYDAQLAALGQAIAQIQLPGLRYSSSLLARLPADTIFFASIPNLADYLGEAESVFEQKTAQSPELQQWMQSHGSRTAAVIEKLRAASEYLGGEIVIAALPNSDGPVFLSEIKRPGFAEFLKQSGLPAAEEERNGLVEFGSPAGVRALSGALDSANGGIAATPFYTRINDVYHNGAGFLVCVNLNRPVNLNGAAQGSAPSGGRTGARMGAGLGAGLGNAQSIILDETQVDGRMEARVSVAFDGPRTGVAGWLASPAPMGTLDYVSPEASLAAAFVVPSGVNIVDQLKVISPKELAPVREALAASLGGEFAIAVDGPIMPVPSWKVVAEVYDPAAAQAAIQKAVAKYAAEAARYHEPSNQKPLTATQETVDGRTYYSLAVPDAGPLLEFHYTFAGGYLIAGPTRAIVAHALQIKTTGLSILRSSKVAAMMPRDHYANFSAVVYQNIGPAIAPIANLLGGLIPQHPGQGLGRQRPGQQPGQQQPSLESLGSMKPTLIAAYAEPDRLTVAANADLIGPSIASLMGGNIAGLAGPLASFFQPKGTRERQMSYR